METQALTSSLEDLQELGVYTGMGDIFMAVIQKMDTPMSPPQYGTPQLIAEGVSFGITPVYAEGKLSASDRSVRKRKMPTGYTIKIEYPRIKAAVRAFLLGHAVDNKGGVLLTDRDAPYVAIGYSANRDSGKPHMRWIYKVKFSEQTIEDKTAEDGALDYRIPVLEGDAVRCDNVVTLPDGSKGRPLRYDADLEGEGCEWTEETFFAEVPQFQNAAE